MEAYFCLVFQPIPYNILLERASDRDTSKKGAVGRLGAPSSA